MFPWSHHENFNEYVKQLMNLRPNEVDQFIKKTIEDNVLNKLPFTPQNNTTEQTRNNTTSAFTKKDVTPQANTKVDPLKINVFESHEDVFIQLPVKHKNDLRAGKIFYNSNQLIIKDIPNIGDKHKVLLPAIVQQRGARIHHKNGILQIKIPKADDIQFTEIDLNF
ncbi:MAG TPA: hypothetical protein GX497_16460 [Bacillus bacterium]|nr:hypothetical protein [Bacillus sp. (in: firmicutes)]